MNAAPETHGLQSFTGVMRQQTRTDEDKRQEFVQIERYGSWWEQAFLRYAMAAVHCAKLVAEMIRTRGYLGSVVGPAANT